jgi:type I restriction enzyme R subunit
MSRQAPGKYTEDAAVEQPAIELFKDLGWDFVNAYHEKFGSDGDLGRESKAEVMLRRSLRSALERLNPSEPADGIDQALTVIMRDRSALHYARANREVHDLLRDRVPVSIRRPDGSKVTERLTVIDWENPSNNEFLLVSQLWVKSDLYERRTDLVAFVNGIPLVFIELKAGHKNLQHAYDDNLRDYRDTIPHLFTANGFIVLSNGAETKVGSITSAWEHFLEWKKINSGAKRGAFRWKPSFAGCAQRNDFSTSSSSSSCFKNFRAVW